MSITMTGNEQSFSRDGNQLLNARKKSHTNQSKRSLAESSDTGDHKTEQNPKPKVPVIPAEKKGCWSYAKFLLVEMFDFQLPMSKSDENLIKHITSKTILQWRLRADKKTNTVYSDPKLDLCQNPSQGARFAILAHGQDKNTLVNLDVSLACFKSFLHKRV